jgi:hypothetical protein
MCWVSWLRGCHDARYASRIESLAMAAPFCSSARTVKLVAVRAVTSRLTGMFPPCVGDTPDATTDTGAPDWPGGVVSGTVAYPDASVSTVTVPLCSPGPAPFNDAWK